MTEYDPFEDPTPRQSSFGKADSFRGRLIMIEPTNVERDVPKKSTNPNGPKGDKITATVTVMDDLGPVQAYSYGVPTGGMIEGPVFRGVWFNQDQITEALQTVDRILRKRVLCRIDTLKPGTKAGEGNPWTVTAATPEEKAQAAAKLAAGIVGAAAPSELVNPWAKQ